MFLRDIVPVQVVVEIQNPQTRYESHVKASDKSFLFGRKVWIVQHCDRIERCLRRFVFNVLRKCLLLLTLTGGVDGLMSSDIMVEAGSYVLCCLCWRVLFHREGRSCALNADRLRLCYFKSPFQPTATNILYAPTSPLLQKIIWCPPHQSDQSSTSSSRRVW